MASEASFHPEEEDSFQEADPGAQLHGETEPHSSSPDFPKRPPMKKVIDAALYSETLIRHQERKSKKRHQELTAKFDRLASFLGLDKDPVQAPVQAESSRTAEARAARVSFGNPVQETIERPSVERFSSSSRNIHEEQMKAAREEQASRARARGTSPFSGNPFSLLATSSLSPAAEAEKDAKYRIKRQDIGIFDPEFPNPQELGAVTDGSRLVYTDVFEFVERMRTILEDDFIAGESERQIIGFFPTLLAGSAVIWWSVELMPENRAQLRQTGLDGILKALEKRFTPDTTIAMEKFNKSRLRLKDVAEDPALTGRFVQRLLRLSKDMGILAEDRSNWIGVVTTIWDKMDPEIRLVLHAPSPSEQLTDFIQRVEKAKYLVAGFARNHVSQRLKAEKAAAYTRKDKKPYSYSGRDSYRPQHDRPRQGDRYDNRRDRQHDERRGYDRPQQGDRYDRRRDEQRDERRDRDGRSDKRPAADDKGKGKERDPKDKPRAYVMDSDSEASVTSSRSSSSVRSADTNGAYIVRDASDFHSGHCKLGCGKSFRSTEAKAAHEDNKTCVKAAKLEARKEVFTLAKRTCRICEVPFKSRNELFRHLKNGCVGTTSSATSPEISPSETSSEPNTPDTVHRVLDIPLLTPPVVPVFEQEHIVRENKPLEQGSTMTMGGYTHMKVKIRGSPNGQDLDACQDTGTGRALVRRDFLSHFSDVEIQKKPTAKIAGYLGPVTKLREWASWSYYAPGTRADGSPGVAQIHTGAWIVDKLDVNLLMSNASLHERKAQVDFEACTITYPDIDGFQIPFQIHRTAGQPVARKVTLREKITLAPKETVHVRVDYTSLPKGRSFMMTATHPAVSNAITDSTTPRIAMLANPTDKPLEIRKGTRLGTIHEFAETAYFLTDASKVATALAAATTTLTEPLSQAQRDVMLGPRYQHISLSSPAFSDRIAAMGAEFTLTPEMEAELTCNPSSSTVSDRAAPDQADALSYIPVRSDSSTPLTDMVHAIIEGKNTIQEAEVVDGQRKNTIQEAEVVDGHELPALDELLTPYDELDAPQKPRISPVASTLGLKIPENAPCIVTGTGISIYSGDPRKARVFQKLCEAYPSIWQDNGPIDMSEEEMMKIPLVEGWQNTKLNFRAYPLGREERAILDKKHDALHEQGRMGYVHGASPFALPVFVVWRMVKGVKKGRVVADLRPLNRVAVPDSYPLPLQQEIINAIRGKKYLTVIDMTNFFFQLMVHPDYRDRFTLISQRGMERSNVCLMGYANSPPHAQRFMDRTLEKHRSYCRAFIDDVIIFSDSCEDHCRHLHACFSLFQEKNMGFSPEKSFIAYPSVELLGFYVDALGMHSTEQRTQGFRGLEFPATLKALETYLGASGFLRSMIPYYAQIADPLQRRKTAMLAEGRQKGRIVNGNLSKRLAYTNSARLLDPTPAELASFQELQKTICEKLMLYHPNPDKQLFLQIDGSLERGFGIMVYHLKDGFEWKHGKTIPATEIEPVMFLSRCLTKAELRYGSSELEVACLVWACKRLRTLLHSSNKRVVVLTDHEATRGIVNATSLNTSSTDRANRRLTNASVYLSAYPLDVYHMPGRLNLVPDALSRLRALGDDAIRADETAEPALDAVWDEVQGEEVGDVFLMSSEAQGQILLICSEARMADEHRQRFMEAYKTDPSYSKIIQDLRPPSAKENEEVLNATKFGHPFWLADGLLYSKDEDGMRRLVVPQALVPEFLRDAHDDKHHFGRERMLEDLAGLHFRRKAHLVHLHVKHCHACGMNRTDNRLPPGALQPIQAPLQPMHTISLDFVTALPTVPSKGTPWAIEGYEAFDCFLATTCKASRRKLLIPGNEKYDAEDWGGVFGRQLLLSDWGCPKAIISDRDPKFTSGFWKGIWKAFNTRLLMTTAWHPQADGQSERTNQIIELAIRHHAYEHPDRFWVDLLPSLQWNLNNAHTQPIDMSPHEYLFGFKIESPADRLIGTSKLPESALQQRFMREHLRRDAQIASDEANAVAKRHYDKTHRWEEFDVGDQVWLRLGKAYRPKGKPNKREMPRRQGPYTVVRKVSPLAYELDIPPPESGKGIHPVISLSHLSRYRTHEDPFKRVPLPPGPVEYCNSDSDDEWELERIVDHKTKPDGTTKYLVRWKGYGPKWDSWKTMKQLNHAKELLAEYQERTRRLEKLSSGDRSGDRPGSRPRRVTRRKAGGKR